MLGFGSTHVYKYDLSDEESLSDDEYAGGINLVSDGVETDAVPTPRRACSFQAWRRSGERASTGCRGGGGLREGIGRLFRRMSRRRRHSRAMSPSHSSDEDLSLNSSVPPLPPSSSSRKRGQYRYRRADTNVVTVKLESLIKPSCMHTGDAEHCAKCNAVLSHLSKLADTGVLNEKMWACEFCGQSNVLDLMPEEVPKVGDLTYMLEPAHATATSGSSGLDESLVIFCIDISGSMCVTTEVPGRVQLRGDHTSRLQALNTEHENQFLPGQARNVTHVSRLQGVQGAVDHQLEEMMREYPNRRVALIAFNNEVVIYGDGSNEPVHLAEHRLTDKDALVKMGSEAILPKAIKDTRKKLGDTIFDLEEGGPTALGPAVLFSVALACQIPGSKVIVCTDGKANVGLGALDTEDLQTAAQFYEEVSAMAVSKGVSVSVTTIKGTDCRMEELGSVADSTGGQVNIVDPLRLTQEFGSILADRIIATNVTATFLTHRGLYIREKDTRENKVVRYVGNVTLNTEITFEYGIKDKVKKANKNKPKIAVVTEVEEQKTAEETNEVEMKVSVEETGAPVSFDEMDVEVPSTSSAAGMDVSDGTNDIDKLTDLPFQLQITYTDIEGAKALRVVTQSKPITTERDVAEQNMDVGVLGVHAAQKSAFLAQHGMYQRSRLSAFANNNLVRKHVSDRCRSRGNAQQVYTDCFTNIQGLERHLEQQQQVEADTWGTNLDEMEEESGDLRMQAMAFDADFDDKADKTSAASEECAAGLSAQRRGLLAELKTGKRSAGPLQEGIKKELRSASRDDELANITYQMKKTNCKMFSKKK